MSDAAKSMRRLELLDDHQSDVGRRRVALAVTLFGGIAVLMGVDLVGDSETGADGTHLVVEAVVMLMAVAGIWALWRGFRAAATRANRLDADLEVARAEAVRYRTEASEALRGLGEAIDSQFDRWALTPAEREVGLLLLKGLSHRDAASVRATSERTVRQQALMIYRKSGMRNRSELSAFFLEDLLLPMDPQPERESR